MIIVRIWQPNKVGVGHASAQCFLDGNPNYISWWPDFGDKKDSAPGRALERYNEDVEMEGRPSDWHTTIKGLNERKGLEWWHSFSGNPTSTYDVRGTNCSWAIATFLLKCGAGEKYSLGQHAYNVTTIAPNLGGFGHILASIRAINPYSDMGAKVEYADYYSAVWTPADVLRIANICSGKRAEDGLAAAKATALRH
ncbi:hypothetical protein SAMN05443551_1252 [Marivita hallyeonensis]|uniref:Uncharacterized protein n=2 Tax=Marivita hallyeonensis TaxID=996342 RepID=A0A1M5PD76_9RHOB|nr:hypothetical protein SAMN05443551_1252 [Marivita hallyeonensis]